MFTYAITYNRVPVYVSKPYANKGAAVTAAAYMVLKVNAACLAANVGKTGVSFEVLPVASGDQQCA